MSNNGPIMRLFEARAKPGRAKELLENFSTTSADVVRTEPGNVGYFFGEVIQGDNDVVMFASLWSSLSAIQDRFGDDWQTSYMPPGYEDLIEECSVRHVDLGSGWNVGT